jgi:hypothetical protein
MQGHQFKPQYQHKKKKKSTEPPQAQHQPCELRLGSPRQNTALGPTGLLQVPVSTPLHRSGVLSPGDNVSACQHLICGKGWGSAAARTEPTGETEAQSHIRGQEPGAKAPLDHTQGGPVTTTPSMLEGVSSSCLLVPQGVTSCPSGM